MMTCITKTLSFRNAIMSTTSIRGFTLFLFLFALGAPPLFSQDRAPGAQRQIKQQIVEESVAAYPGNCACPYNITRNGRSCGGRSAWSRKGGHAPICYEREVTQDMVRERQQQLQEQARQDDVIPGRGSRGS